MISAWLCAGLTALLPACSGDGAFVDADVGGGGAAHPSGAGGASAVGGAGGAGGTDPGGTYTTDPSDPTDLYQILEIAPAGVVIEVRGTQYVDDTFLSRLKDEQALVGDVSPTSGEPVPILRHADGNTTAVHSTRTAALAGVTLKNLNLENVSLALESPKDEPDNIQRITFRNLIFENATTVPWGEILHMGPFIEVLYSSYIVVTRCQFRRDSPSYGGRGVTFRFTTNSIVHGSHIGADRNLSQKWGHFKTGVNLSGYANETVRTRNIKVADNFIRRKPIWGQQDGSPNGSADHFMYGWGYLGWHITGNRFDGWPADRSGQLKLRGGEETIVYRNRLHGGGFTLKAEMAGAGPKLFKKASLSRNFVQMTEPLVGSYTGFLSWRNGEPACSTAYESDITFVRNTMWGGGGARAMFSGVRPDRVCLLGNRDYAGAGLPPAEYKAGSGGCAPHLTAGCAAGEWLEHLPGVYAGDFNGDGKEDLAFRVGNDWAVHRSTGDKYVIDKALTESGAYNAATYDYGAAVGDFDGDGRDDLVYPGSCGGAACWRVLRAEGDPVTFTAVSFGAAGLNTLGPDSAAYGLVVGHFGAREPGETPKHDIAFLGADGLRVNLSDGASFDSSVWSATLNNGGLESETQMLGIQAGDFDGDGFDDLVVRAKCGSPAADCWRMLRSDGSSAFTAQNWGALGIAANANGGPGMTSYTRHFGLFVGDRDGDGKSDLAFVSHSTCGWQYLTPNAAGDAFEGTCSPGYDLTKVPE